MPLTRNAVPATPIGDSDYYNPQHYPHFVGRHTENAWDIYASDDGRTAAVAVGEDRLSSHFGDRHHLIYLMRQFPGWDWQLSEYGAKFVGEKVLNLTFPELEPEAVG